MFNSSLQAEGFRDVGVSAISDWRWRSCRRWWHRDGPKGRHRAEAQRRERHTERIYVAHEAGARRGSVSGTFFHAIVRQ